MRNRIPVVLGLIAALLVAAAPTSAQAVAKPVICPGGDSGKIESSGDPREITVTAPEGYLISGYCAKGGRQTEFVTLDPPQQTATITVSNGKAVSHYSLTYTEGDESEYGSE